MKNRKSNWQIYFAVGLVALSGMLYSLHYMLFHDSHHIIIYLIGDIAFVPIEVLLVTLILHQLLESRQKRLMKKKLNMVIGTFFSEIGTQLLQDLAVFCTNIELVRPQFQISPHWTNKDFDNAQKTLKNNSYTINAFNRSPLEVRDFLQSKRSFLLNLLANPNLLEHEEFTDLLWAVIHLTEELLCRTDFDNLPESDKNHLSGDMKRAYILLIDQWLSYMKHLKTDYPYLFSLAARINPFNPQASPVVQ